MVTNRKYLLMLLFIILCSVHATAQTDFYYYKGEKIPLTRNENKVIVSIPKECDGTGERIQANAEVLFTISDSAFQSFVITQSDLEKLASLDFWKEDEKFVILTSSYYTAENNEEVYATPYLNVKLMKKEDVDLLASYAEEYKLKIVRNVPSMPLWYILHVTLDSEKSPLQCANELYETGKFAASIPDLAADNILTDETTVRNINSARTDASSKIYDLSGRSMSHSSNKGVFIRNGRKVVK